MEEWHNVVVKIPEVAGGNVRWVPQAQNAVHDLYATLATICYME